METFFNDDTGILIREHPIVKEFYLCECGYEECRPTKPYEFIPIDYWVIHYCVFGEGYFHILDNRYHIQAGDIFIIPPHTRNKYYPNQENPWSYKWVGLRGTRVGKILSMCGISEKDCVLHYNPDPQLEALFEKVYTESYQEHNLTALGTVFHILDHLRANIGNSKTEHLSSSEIYFQHILNYIHKNYFNNINISDIAEANNIDRTYVFKLFQKYKNISPSQYLQHYRLDKACILLRKTSLSITDIGYAVGFQHIPYFTKLFKEYIGITPSEYRKKFMQFGLSDSYAEEKMKSDHERNDNIANLSVNPELYNLY